MSFSSQVKEELVKQISSARHCQIAEIAGIIGVCGEVKTSDTQKTELVLRTENVFVARKYFTLLEKTFNISVAINIHENPYQTKGKVYNMYISDHEDAARVLKTANHGAVIQKKCCKRAFLRGCFLASGSISSPEKFYHLEISSSTEDFAERVREVFCDFGIDAKIVVRKKQYVVYIKEGEQIVDSLALMEANQALMEFENIRIIKEMRNDINRRVNCETANLNKTINASIEQIEAIRKLKKTGDFEKMDESLKEIAELRVGNPNASLIELGKMLKKPVGKSGVNYRLKKIMEIANGK